MLFCIVANNNNAFISISPFTFAVQILNVNFTSALVDDVVILYYLKNIHILASTCSFSVSHHPVFSVFLTLNRSLSLSVHVVRPSQFKIRFKLQDWLWLSVVPSEFLPTRNLAFNGILPCC